jgi:hypothetical protein
LNPDLTECYRQGRYLLFHVNITGRKEACGEVP